MQRLKQILLLLLGTIVIFSACKEEVKPSADEQTTGDAVIDELTYQIDENPDNAQLLFERSKAFHEREAFDRAVIDMEKAMKIDSLNPDYYRHLSDVFMDYYKSRRAYQTMLVARKLFPERVPTLLKLAETQYILKLYDQSISTINEIFYLKKENAEAFFMLGLNLRAQNDLKRATEALKQAVDRDPELIDAWLLLGEIAEQEKDPLAGTYYDNAVRIAPENIYALHSKAYYTQINGDIQGAIDLYRKIVSIDREYTDAYLNMGILYTEMDSLDLAYEQFNIIAKTQTTNAKAYYFRGLVQELKGNIPAARADYKSAIAMDPSMERAQMALKEIKDK